MTCCAFDRGVVLVLGLALLCAGPALADRPNYETFELINPLLGPDYAQWLLGPVSWMADKKEVETFQTLTSDEAAAQFIEDFWAERDPYPKRPDNPLRETFRERADEADSLYAEGGLPGYRTDRGTVYVLYGEPEEVDYQVSPDPGDPLLELWIYPKDAPEGLDGNKPDRTYRFVKRDDLTRFYQRMSARDRERARRERRLDPTRNPFP